MSDDLNVKADMDLANELRQGFTASACVEALLRAVCDMAAAVGVYVNWRIVGTDAEKIVDKTAITKALGRLATSGGALLAGSQVNPVAQDPMQILKEKQGGK